VHLRPRGPTRQQGPLAPSRGRPQRALSPYFSSQGNSAVGPACSGGAGPVTEGALPTPRLGQLVSHRCESDHPGVRPQHGRHVTEPRRGPPFPRRHPPHLRVLAIAEAGAEHAYRQVPIVPRAARSCPLARMDFITKAFVMVPGLYTTVTAGTAWSRLVP
jgi:hypothetical protein